MATYTPTATASAAPAALGTWANETSSSDEDVTSIWMPAISDSDVPARSRAETTSGRKRANRSELMRQASAPGNPRFSGHLSCLAAGSGQGHTVIGGGARIQPLGDFAAQPCKGGQLFS